MNQPEPITSQIFATDCLEEYQRLEEELTELWHLIDGIDTKRKRAVLLMTKCQEAHKALWKFMAHRFPGLALGNEMDWEQKCRYPNLRNAEQDGADQLGHPNSACVSDATA